MNVYISINILSSIRGIDISTKVFNFGDIPFLMLNVPVEKIDLYCDDHTKKCLKFTPLDQ